MSQICQKYREEALQYAVRHHLSDSGEVFRAESGKSLQILCPGMVNPGKGPDFRNALIFLGGDTFSGNMEFHRKASDWYAHGHSSDPLYQSLILHIVFENDCQPIGSMETLIIDRKIISMIMKKISGSREKVDFRSLDDLRKWAIARIQRKSQTALDLLMQFGLYHTWQKMTGDFLESYRKKSRRPVYDNSKLMLIGDKIACQPMFGFLRELADDWKGPVKSELERLGKKGTHGLGRHLTREIFVNCLLPIALSMANDWQKLSIYEWFWDARSSCKYGGLKRRFPAIPQEYVWQQQAMLEYLRSMRQKSQDF